MSALILDMEERYESYLKDESRMKGNGEKIAFPGNVEEVCQVFDYCRKCSMPLTVQGSRTGIVGAAVPSGGMILNLSKMDRITGIREEGGQFYLEAEPGVLLKDLNERLDTGRFDTADWTEAARKSLENMGKAGPFRFAPDPTETTASIGGMYASNAKGISGYRYGRMSDHTEQITFVTMDGSVWNIPRGKYRADSQGCPLPDGSRLPALFPDSRQALAPDGQQILAPDGHQALSPDGHRVLFPDGHQAMSPDSQHTLSPDRQQPGQMGPWMEYPLVMKPGEDLVDLIGGSEGMLGAVVSLELKLVKPPAESWGILFFFRERKAAEGFAGDLGRKSEDAGANGILNQESGDAEITGAEYFDKASLEVVEQMKGKVTSLKSIPQIPAKSCAAVYVTVEAGSQEGAEAYLLDLLDLFETWGGRETDSWAATGMREMEKFRLFCHGVHEGINNRVDEIKRRLPEFVKMEMDFGGWGEEFGHRIEACVKNVWEAGVEAVIFGHALEGSIHVNLLPGTEEEKMRAEALMECWAEEKAVRGECLAAENGVGKVNTGLVRKRIPREVLESMKRIKEHMDQDGLLNQGNMGL